MCQDHKFLDWHAAQQKYGLTGKDVMKWFGIIKAIPNTWKKVVKNELVYLQVEMPLARYVGALHQHVKYQLKMFTICFSNPS